MPDHLPQMLQSGDVQVALVEALERAYDISQERHDPLVGDDAMTFGIHVWKSGAHFLAEAVVAAGGTAELVNQSLAMRLGDVELRHHKLGDSELDNPETAFPNHPGPAARMAGRAVGVQLELDLQEEEATASQIYLDWVLGSYGNPEDGLRAVRLQAVGSNRALDGTISRWEDVVTLYDASLGLFLPLATPYTEAAADVEITPEPEIRLRRDEAERDAGRPA